MKKIKFTFIFVLLAFFSCKKEVFNINNKENQNSPIKYAKGFDIIEKKGAKFLIIKSPYKNSSKHYVYQIKHKSDSSNIIVSNQKTLNIPINNIVATSTTHIPMIELLGKEKSIIGFPFSKYISSEKTSKLVENDFIREIGKEGAINTEIILELQPELVIGYGVSTADKSLSVVEKAGINVIYNGDWLEETPLGRAEWIKFFGILFDKEKEADSIFKQIETDYLDASKIALNSKLKPTILSGAIMNKEIWNLPAGKSFVSQFLNDANLDYLWKNTEGTGSLFLSIESVFEKGKDADYWISPGYFSSKEQLTSNNSLYEKFKAFKQDKIYTPTTKKGKTGGVIYYELAPTRPDLVLKDLIKITNPDLLAEYELTFFEKME